MPDPDEPAARAIDAWSKSLTNTPSSSPPQELEDVYDTTEGEYWG